MIVSVVENGEQRSLRGVRIDVRLSQLKALSKCGPGEYDFAGVRLVVKEDPPAPKHSPPAIEVK